MKVSKENIGISHLFFADDLTFFAKVSEKESEAIKEVLDKFCEELGQVLAMISHGSTSPQVPQPTLRRKCVITSTSKLHPILESIWVSL